MYERGIIEIEIPIKERERLYASLYRTMFYSKTASFAFHKSNRMSENVTSSAKHLPCGGKDIVLVIIKLTKKALPLRFRCGSCQLNFVVISPWFAILKNVVHSLEPGETPVAFIFSIYLKPVLYNYREIN